jgi:hypothetical protein
MNREQAKRIALVLVKRRETYYETARVYISTNHWANVSLADMTVVSDGGPLTLEEIRLALRLAKSYICGP